MTTADTEADLRRARIVIENLAARVGMLTAENLELLVRLQERGQQQEQPSTEE